MSAESAKPLGKRRRWLRRMIFLGCAYLVLLLLIFFGGCADKLILHPTTERLDAHGAQRRTIPFQGGQLEAWTARSSAAKTTEPKLIQIEFIGNGSRAEWMPVALAERWGGLPVEVWAINYAGYGGSSGPATLKSIPPGALAAYDAAAAAYPGKPILLSGHSLGTTAAIYAATKRPAAGLFLHNPPPLRRVIMTEYGWWNLWLIAAPVAIQVPGELESLSNAPQLRCPSVVIVGMNDTFVPTALQLKVADACPEPKRIIKFNGDHNTWAEGPEVTAAMRWLYEQAMAK